jgi:uncharacterized protein YdiU (UPF0061 family)
METIPPRPTPAPSIGELSNTFAALPDVFHSRILPTRVAAPQLLRFNQSLGEELGLDLAAVDPTMLAAIFAGNVLPAGAAPVAMAYAGHQFGNFVPQLGDGRALLLAELVDRTGQRRDIHLKGSGRTPYSRGGDGRAGLGPVLREFIVSEAMHALRIPTTRALAAVATGETIMRDTPVPGAVLTRIGASHIRVGTFEYHAARNDTAAVRTLADYAIGRHYPDARQAPNPYFALLQCVADRQATLIADWMRVGFIHGVMNTDNMAISGETIDFGPCAFMDEWNPSAVYSAIDRRGRYAFSNQPGIAQWNLARLAETLLPLIDEAPEKAVEAATGVLLQFMTTFEGRRMDGLRAKIGLSSAEPGDRELIQVLLDGMHAQSVDHTNLFRRLADAVAGQPDEARALYTSPAAFDAWSIAWRSRLERDPATESSRIAAMRSANPAIIPRNHQIERAIRSAIDGNELAPFHALTDALQAPYSNEAALGPYAAPPAPAERVLQTFCGT